MKSDVMIIEDQKAAAALYGEVLEEAGVAVDHFENGAEALEAIVSGVKSYSLIITDYQVPGLDGLTLLKRLKQRFAYLPVLFITAHGSVETAIEAMKQGAFDYQEKPIDLDRLVELAREACARAGDAPSSRRHPRRRPTWWAAALRCWRSTSRWGASPRCPQPC
jgi:DNA-binding NtrC family response regulator